MPCSGPQNIARSYRCKTPKSGRNRIQHYRHTVLLSTRQPKHCPETPMPNIKPLGNTDVTISNRSETPMLPSQTARNHRRHHIALLGTTGANIAHRSEPPMQNTKIKAKPHLALSPHCLPSHKNRCHARATKMRNARNSRCRKPMPTLGQNRVVSPNWP